MSSEDSAMTPEPISSERREKSKLERRIETNADYQEWIRRVQGTGIGPILSDTALNLLYIALGNECWRLR